MEKYTKKDQLRELIASYPNKNIDYIGVLLDFISEQDCSLFDAMELKPQLYRDIFVDEENKETAIRILKLTLRTEKNAGILEKQCVDIFPKISELIRQLQSAENSESQLIFSFTEEKAGLNPNAVIWQISDLHFGDFNTLENNPIELASLLIMAAHEIDVIPDIIIVSGDITSRGKNEEYIQFLKFAEYLSHEFWGRISPEKLLLIPGNHEACWLPNGQADKLNKFREFSTTQDIVTTPFSNSGEKRYDDEEVVVRWYHSEHDVPPLAVIEYRRYNFEIILLVSPYFSGEIDKRVIDKLEQVSGDAIDRDLIDLLRVDKGSINNNYLKNITTAIQAESRLRFGVIHHNTCQIGVEACINPKAVSLMEVLYKKSTHLLFHGHTHQREDTKTNRPVVPGQAFPVPCTSLSSHCHSFGNGFNLYFMGNNGKSDVISCYTWEISGSHLFSANQLYLRYRFELLENKLTVTHNVNRIHYPKNFI